MGERMEVKHYPAQVPLKLEIPEFPVPQILTNSAKEFPNETALISGKEKISYRELEEKSNCFAHSLQRLGVKKGEKVAMLLLNSFEVAITFFGTLKAGAILVPLNPRFTEKELKYILRDSEVKVVICFGPLIKKIEQVVEKETKIITTPLPKGMVGFPKQLMLELWKIGRILRKKSLGIPFKKLLQESPNYQKVRIKPDDLAVIQYTAGTTGQSKGVMITHKNIIANVLQINAIAWTMEKSKETFLVIVPPFHVAGLVNILCWGIYLAAKQVLLPRFHPSEALEAMLKYKPSFFFGVPAIFAALLKVMKTKGKGYRFDFLKFAAIGTAPCSTSLFRKLQKIFPEITEGYGLTETTGVCFANPIGGLKKVGSVGIPFPGVGVKIVDPQSREELRHREIGEILIKGPNVSPGYWKLHKETEKIFKNGWIATGDAGYIDEDGYLYIVDRLKDIINVRGEKVSSLEVERVLAEHPAISEAAVIGVPDPYWGEKVVGYLVLKKAITTREILEYCRKNLADYKIPQKFKIVESLPKSAMGKILKRELRKEVVLA